LLLTYKTRQTFRKLENHSLKVKFKTGTLVADLFGANLQVDAQKASDRLAAKRIFAAEYFSSIRVSQFFFRVHDFS